MRKYITIYLTGLSFLLFLACSVKEVDKTASVKAPASPKPGSVRPVIWIKRFCHRAMFDTSEMAGKVCDSCHSAAQTSLRTKMPLSHKHQLNGLTCKECHETQSLKRL
jgi:hypothetical protein